jgi:hypothetical protein
MDRDLEIPNMEILDTQMNDEMEEKKKTGQMAVDELHVSRVDIELFSDNNIEKPAHLSENNGSENQSDSDDMQFVEEEEK